MDFPFPNNAPADAGAPTDDFWAFNPQQPPPMNAQADDTSLDELLALYQTAQDAPPAPFAPMGEPESYTGFDAGPAFGDPAVPGADPFAGFGDPATDAPFPAFGDPAADFGAGMGGFDAPAFPAFGDAAADPFGAPAADAFGAPAGFEAVVPEAGGFEAGASPFDSAVPDLGAGMAFPAFDAAPDAPAGFDLGASPFDSSVPDFGAPATDAGFGGFDAPAELPADFGADMGAAFPAFDAAPAELPTDFDAGAAFPAFDAAPAELPADFDAGTAFPAFDAAPDALGDLSGGPVFDAFPAAEAPSELPADFGADLGGAFPAFDAAPAELPADFDAGAAFPAFDAAPAELPTDFGSDMGAAFPAFEAATDLGDLAGGPVFDAFPAAEAPAAPDPVLPVMNTPEPASGGFLFAEEEPQEFVPDDDAPLFPAAIDEGPVFPAFDAAAFDPAPVAPAIPEPVAAAPADDEPQELPADFGSELAEAFPAFDVVPAVEPVVEPPVARAPVAPTVDPEQTLRYREVPATPAAAGPALDLAALANLTGREVVVKTAEDRRAANQQLTQVVGALSTGLDEIQGKMAHLYADLQKAAVSRAPVEEIQQITVELAAAKSSVGEGSELHKQALYLRQMADAYLQMLKDL